MDDQYVPLIEDNKKSTTYKKYGAALGVAGITVAAALLLSGKQKAPVMPAELIEISDDMINNLLTAPTDLNIQGTTEPMLCLANNYSMCHYGDLNAAGYTDGGWTALKQKCDFAEYATAAAALSSDVDVTNWCEAKKPAVDMYRCITNEISLVSDGGKDSWDALYEKCNMDSSPFFQRAKASFTDAQATEWSANTTKNVETYHAKYAYEGYPLQCLANNYYMCSSQDVSDGFDVGGWNELYEKCDFGSINIALYDPYTQGAEIDGWCAQQKDQVDVFICAQNNANMCVSATWDAFYNQCSIATIPQCFGETKLGMDDLAVNQWCLKNVGGYMA